MPRARPVPPPLRGRPFTTAQARSAGLSQGALRASQFRQLFRDVYLESAIQPTLRLRVQGLQLVIPVGSAFSHATAAELYGLPVRDARLHVSVPSAHDRPGPRSGVRLHESLPARDVWVWTALPLATPTRTFVDLAEDTALDDLVVLGDAVLRRLATRDGLEAAVGRAGRRRGVVRARQALPLLREGVDSPMESRLRLALVRAELPCPEVNVPVYDATGGLLGTGDLVYRDARIVLEYEGDQHRTDRQQWRNDLWRYERFADAGWLVIRVTADDVLRRPALLVERVRRRLAERAPRG